LKRISLFTAAIAVAYSTTALTAASTHEHIEGQSCPLHGDSFISAEGVAAKKSAQKQLLMQRSAQGVSASATMDNPAVIDVAVLMHATWIEAMKEQLTQDANGKYYENGAQFAVERIKAQYAYFNESLRLQNVPVVLRPVYFAETDNQILTGQGSASQQDETRKTWNCLLFPVGALSDNSYCEASNLGRVNEITRSNVDLFHYVREIADEDGVGGLGGFFEGSAVFDVYRRVVGVVKASNAAGENLYTNDDMNSLRFGHVNATTLTHEYGHVFGGMHNVTEEEPADGKDNRAYECGKVGPKSSDYPNGKKTHRAVVKWRWSAQ